MSVVRCPDCGEPFAPVGYSVHRGMKHQPKRCRYRGDNRGWCTVHDAEWRIDRRKCEASWDALNEHFAATERALGEEMSILRGEDS